MFCPGCGKDVGIGKNFCPDCGAVIPDIAKHKGNNTIKFIAVIVGVIAVIVSIAIILLVFIFCSGAFKNNKSVSNEQSTESGLFTTSSNDKQSTESEQSATSGNDEQFDENDQSTTKPVCDWCNDRGKGGGRCSTCSGMGSIRTGSGLNAVCPTCGGTGDFPPCSKCGRKSRGYGSSGGVGSLR